jgi:hypothetical protein
MSEEFIQFTIPCETCIVQSMCTEKENVKDKKINTQHKMCLSLPEWNIEEKIYLKGLFECMINLSWKITEALTREKIRDDEEGSQQSRRIPTQYIDMLIDVVATLQWMINSTSWKEGKLHNFDAYEIKHKLKNVTHWLTDENKPG